MSIPDDMLERGIRHLAKKDIRAKTEELFRRVNEEKFDGGWTLIWDGDPWCRQNTKTIFMKEMDTPEGTAQLLLHEVAHALEGGGHDSHFWRCLQWLVGTYLNTTLNKKQLKMKADYGY